MKRKYKNSILSSNYRSYSDDIIFADGYSCIDGKSDIITAIFYDMPIQFCIVLIYSLIFKPLESSIAKYILLLIRFSFLAICQ